MRFEDDPSARRLIEKTIAMVHSKLNMAKLRKWAVEQAVAAGVPAAELETCADEMVGYVLKGLDEKELAYKVKELAEGMVL